MNDFAIHRAPRQNNTTGFFSEVWIFILIFFPFLWDYYIFSLRIFDIISFFIIIFITMLTIIKKSKKITAPPKILFFLSFIVLYATFGLLVSQDFRSFLGIIMGVIYFALLPSIISSENIMRIMRIVLIVMVSAFLIQFVYAQLFNDIINYHSLTGGVPRLESGRGLRSSGLFLEPTSYVTTLTMILIIQFISKKFGRLEFIGIITMYLSMSFFAYFAATILLFIYMYGLKENMNMRWFLFLFLFIFTVLSVFVWIFSDLVNIFFIERLINISEDPSVIARFGFFSNFNFDNSIIFFGHGLSSFNSGFFGYSGLGSLLSNFGIFGIFIFIFIFISVFRRNFLLAGTGFSIILMAGPLWTYLVLWSWFSMLYVLSEDKKKNCLQSSIV